MEANRERNRRGDGQRVDQTEYEENAETDGRMGRIELISESEREREREGKWK